MSNSIDQFKVALKRNYSPMDQYVVLSPKIEFREDSMLVVIEDLRLEISELRAKIINLQVIVHKMENEGRAG